MLVAGVDEAGRGPLAGPVVAAAVILDPKRPIRGLRDSKQLTPERRAVLAERIRERALGVAVAVADHGEMDLFNILQATLLAMKWALLDLPVRPGYIRIDGNCAPQLNDCFADCEVKTVIGGDASVACISAASIIAKTHRDALMRSSMIPTRATGSASTSAMRRACILRRWCAWGHRRFTGELQSGAQLAERGTASGTLAQRPGGLRLCGGGRSRLSWCPP